MSTPSSIVIALNDDTPHSESFDPERLYASIEAACLSVGLAPGLAEDTAHHVTWTVELWLRTRPEVTSEDIRRIAARSLTIISPEAAYLYKHQHTML